MCAAVRGAGYRLSFMHRRALLNEMAPTALVVAEHATVAGLVGGLLETAGYRTSTPDEGEAVDSALSRLRPSLVLLDAEHAAAIADATYQKAAVAGTGVLLFSPGLPFAEVARRALERGAAAFELPAEYRASPTPAELFDGRPRAPRPTLAVRRRTPRHRLR
jgi:hypothetical protein